MDIDHLHVLSTLSNGVLTREEQLSVLKWATCFAKTCVANQMQNMDSKYRVEKCSVCAFISRCGVLGHALNDKIQALDRILHTVGVHLPVNWTVICILGGFLMDAYDTTVDVQLDPWFLQPGDIIHHYMISSDCLYDRDGPMVVIRDAFSLLIDKVPRSDDDEVPDDNWMHAEDGLSETDDFMEEEVVEIKKNSPDQPNNAKSLIDGIISMINSSDVSQGRCDDMAYIDPADNALKNVMQIPHFVMFGDILSDHVSDEGGATIHHEEKDNLYDIYKDLVVVVDNEHERDSMGAEPFNITAAKKGMLMLWTYEWMKNLAANQA